MMKKTVALILLSLGGSRGMKETDAPPTIEPIIVTEDHLHSKISSKPISEFTNDHAVKIDSDQIVSKMWYRHNLDGTTETISPPEKIDPLVPPTFSSSGPTSTNDDNKSGFDISDLSIYDDALNLNRNTISENAMSQENIAARLNKTMALLAPLRKALSNLQASEKQQKKELQIMKLKAKHDKIVEEKKKFKEEEDERMAAEKKLEEMKMVHEQHLADIKKHLMTLNGELHSTDAAENNEEEGLKAVEEEDDEEEEAEEEVEDNEMEKNSNDETEEEIKEAQLESSIDELAVADESATGGATGSSSTGSSATGSDATGSDATGSDVTGSSSTGGDDTNALNAREQDDDEDEDEDEEMLSSGILKDKEKIAGIEDEGEKTEIESEVDMDGENDKAEGETNNDDKLLDNISLESEATRERLNSKLAER
jgi:hypothetical protein